MSGYAMGCLVSNSHTGKSNAFMRNILYTNIYYFCDMYASSTLSVAANNALGITPFHADVATVVMNKCIDKKKNDGSCCVTYTYEFLDDIDEDDEDNDSDDNDDMKKDPGTRLMVQ